MHPTLEISHSIAHPLNVLYECVIGVWAVLYKTKDSIRRQPPLFMRAVHYSLINVLQSHLYLGTYGDVGMER